jgi:ABC-type transport system substrate-binding protein
MDMNNLTLEDIREYTSIYMWGDAPKNQYPSDWEVHPDDAHVDEYCWADHTNDPDFPRTGHMWCCHCGCGRVANTWYLPGHDQKHYGALIREWQVAVNNRDRARIIRNAQKHTTDGVWSKFMTRTAIRIVRGAEGKVYFMSGILTAVTKVGRWYYPVLSDVTGRLVRAVKPIKDEFDAGHQFEYADIDRADVEYLYEIINAQIAARETVTA